jgi:hypothetical protein
MTEHNQTIFLIERLQPSWLSARWQSWAYIVTSRLTWGILAGLVFGLLIGLSGALQEGLKYGMVVGPIGGLTGGLVDIIRLARQNLSKRQNDLGRRQNIRGVVLVMLMDGLLGGFIGAVMGWVIGEAAGGVIGVLILGVMAGLVFGLFFGLVWIFRNLANDSRNEIETVETIRFSWTRFPIGFKNGLILGLILGLIFTVFAALLDGLSGWLAFELLIGLIGGLIGGLLNCFQPGIRELKTIPNQGVWLSLRSAGLMGGLGGLALGLIVGLIGGRMTGLVYCVLGGLCVGLWYGGLDVIQHFLVRFLLWRAGSLPWRLASFLDYAAEELHFLQKVGGGYIFVHRYLLEHFAAMETDDNRSATPVE